MIGPRKNRDHDRRLRQDAIQMAGRTLGRLSLRSELCGIAQNGFCAACLGDVLSGANHSNRLSSFIEDNLSASVKYPLRSVGSDYAMVKGERLTCLQRLADYLLRNRPVVRMSEAL